MMKNQKAYGAIVALVIGLFLLLEGSKLDPWMVGIHVAFIVIGAVLTIAYFYLIGDYLERTLRAPGIVTLMPVLLVLGAILIYQGALRPLEVVNKALLAVAGILLIVGSAFVLYRSKGKK